MINYYDIVCHEFSFKSVFEANDFLIQQLSFSKMETIGTVLTYSNVCKKHDEGRII
jgi:hypothetical protein